MGVSMILGKLRNLRIMNHQSYNSSKEVTQSVN